MKKISIYCVNYNSYEYLAAFIKSVDAAASKVGGEAVVTVYGMNGSMVSETAIEGVGEVSTAGLAQGVYVVKVATASGIHTAKLIVK